MDEAKVAARFAAFVWYLNERPDGVAADKAGQLARRNWREFLPCADDTMCRLVGEPMRPRRRPAMCR